MSLSNKAVQYNHYYHVAIAGQQAFSDINNENTFVYSPEYFQVFTNGVSLLNEENFTVTNEIGVNLAYQAELNDNIIITTNSMF